jgi:hypothetical protein
MQAAIQEIESKLGKMEGCPEVTSEVIENELLEPLDEKANYILKCSYKFDAFQDVLFGLKQIDDEIPNVKEWLNCIRKISKKQFKYEFRRHQLLNE